MEVGIFAQTPGNEGFAVFTSSLEYNSDALQPVRWSLTPGATGVLTAEELLEDAKALGLNGTGLYCGDLQVLTDADIDEGVAQGGGTPYEGALSDGGTAMFNALYFSASSRKAVAYPEKTLLAVIRFYDRDAKFDTTGTGEDIKVTYGSQEVTSANVTDFVRFTDDAKAEASPAEQSVWYASGKTQFYYVASYDGDPANLVDVPFNGATLQAPDTIGRKVLAVDAAGTETDPGYYSYTTNLLDRVPIEVSSKLSFNAGGGTDIDNLATILFYDWDDSLLGTLTVEKGDARAEVNDYIESNFIHPDLKASTHIDAAYTDSTEREYSYRGIYPSVAPGKTGNFTVDANGYKYPLTNKLDYVFYKWATTKTVENDFADPSDSTNIIPQVNLWTTKPVSTETDAKEYPYVNGWAKVENVKNMSAVWTTFGANGELRKCDPETGSFITYGDSSYFDFIDFSDLDPGVYYAKACYVQGPELLDLVQYRIINGPYFSRYGTAASPDNATYSVQYQYERAYQSSDGVRGVTRVREPAVQVQNYPDMMKADVENGFSQPFYSTTAVKNLDVMDVDITSAGGVWHFNYTLVDVYGKNIATGDARSQTGNEMSVPENFLYDQVANDYNDRFGTDGLVFQATLHTVLYEGTMSILGETNSFTDHADIPTITDLNLRVDSRGAEVSFSTIYDIQDAILDAIKGVYLRVGPSNPGEEPRDRSYFYEDGAVKLDWHQLQYHILNWKSGGIFAGGGIMTPEACGAYGWCRLDDCNGGSMDIASLSDLLRAGYMVYSNQQPNALNTLTPEVINDLFLRAENTGVRYTTIPAFKADLTTAISKLVSPGPYAESDIVNADWMELQYALINGAYKSKADILLDRNINYWWADGKTPEINALPQLFRVSYRVYVEGHDPSMMTQLSMNVVDALYFRSGVNGQRFTTLEEFKSALESAVRTMAASGTYTAETIAAEDWIVLQHLLLPGTTYRDTQSLRDDPAIDYWWEDGGNPKVETAGDFMHIIYQAYGPEGDTSFINNVDLVKALDSLKLRADDAGTAYTTTGAIVTAAQNALRVLCLDPGAPYTADTLRTATWKEVQHALIYHAYRPDGNIPDNEFWWLTGDYPNIGDQEAILKFAYKVFVEHKDAALLNDLTIDTVKANWYATDTNGTLFNRVTEFKTALEKAVRALTSGDPPPYTAGELDQVTWKEFQYALIFGEYKKDAEITEDFWWEGGGHKTIETLPDLLIAAYQAYGDKSNPAALDGLTDDDMERISNDPFWFRSEKENGTPFASMTTFKTAMDIAIANVKLAGFGAENIHSLDWMELQHLLLGNSYKSKTMLESDPSINYWWWDNGSKPVGINADAAIAELLLLDSQLMMGEPVDESVFMEAISKYIDDLALRDSSNQPYTSSHTIEFRAMLDDIVMNVYTWFDPNFMDPSCMYAEMTWNEVQFYILNGGAFELEENIEGYPWRPGGPKASLINVGAPVEILGEEPPTEIPEERPVESPGEPSVETPEERPVESPEEPSAGIPEERPVESPEEPPTEIPEERPVEPPVEIPEERPVESPEEPPDEVPVERPVEFPEEPPVEIPEERPSEEEEFPADIPEQPPATTMEIKPSGQAGQEQGDTYGGEATGQVSGAGPSPTEGTPALDSTVPLGRLCAA